MTRGMRRWPLLTGTQRYEKTVSTRGRSEEADRRPNHDFAAYRGWPQFPGFRA